MKINKRILILSATMLISVSAFATDKFTEVDLSAMEYKNGSKSASKLPFLQKQEALSRFPVLAYLEAFNAEAKKIVVTPHQKKDIDLMKGIEVPAGIATSPVFVAGGVNTTTGAIGNMATVIVAAGIGLNILSKIFGHDVNADARKREIASMQLPSLYLTKVTAGTKGDDQLRAVQMEAYNLVKQLPFGCEPAANRFEENSIGYATENRTHTRLFVCGFASEEKGEQDIAWNDMRGVWSSRFEQQSDPAGAFSIIKIAAIDKMRYAKMLGIQVGNEEQKKLLGKLAFDKARGVIPPDWAAVYTAPNATNEWAVFVFRNGETIEFPIPKS